MKRMDHVGIAVNNIEDALKLYVDMLNLTPWDRGIVEIADKGLKVVLLPIGENNIELLQPTNPENREARFLRERGEGLFHITIETDNFDTDVKTLKEKGFAVEEEVTTGLFHGYMLRLAWLPPEDTQGVWIELVDLASVPASLKRH